MISKTRGSGSLPAQPKGHPWASLPEHCQGAGAPRLYALEGLPGAQCRACPWPVCSPQDLHHRPHDQLPGATLPVHWSSQHGPEWSYLESARVSPAGSRPGEAWSRLRGNGTCAAICDPRAPPGMGLTPGGVPIGASDSSSPAMELSVVSPATSSSLTRARFPGRPGSGDLQAHGGGQNGRSRK